MSPKFWSLAVLLIAFQTSSPACLRFMEEEVPSITHTSLKETLQQHEDRSVWEKRVKVRKEETKKVWDFRIENNMTVALVHLGRLDEALNRMETVERKYPNQIATAYNLGTVYELKGDLPKAQLWIKRGVELELRSGGKSHLDGTEWLHLRILDAKMGLKSDPSNWKDQAVSGLDFGRSRVPVAPETFPSGNDGAMLTLAQVQNSLQEQLHERLEFVKAPDPIVGDLLFDFANVLAVNGNTEDALDIYQMALQFSPTRSALARARFDYFAGTPNYLLIGCCCSLALGSGGFYFIRRNKQRNQEWKKLPIQTLDDLGPERKTAFLDFSNLRVLMAKATPLRSGDQLAGLAAESAQERVAARQILADLPLQLFLDEPLIPPENDEVSRLILESHCESAFRPIKNFSVGQLRDWLLAYSTTSEVLAALAPGLTPEMAAAVSKIMGNQDLIQVAAKCRTVTRFRNTLGLAGRLSTRLQPNHPTDDPRGIAASILDGLLLGSGDAVIGINPATDSTSALDTLTKMLDELIQCYGIPTQSCVLGHITTQIGAIERGVPVDLVFQSIAGTQAANSSFGIDLKMLQEGLDAACSLGRGTLGNNVMYFETGQGSCLSANAHHGIDQQTLEARAYAVARHFQPLLVNTVVGFIGPEYLYDGKQIIRAGLEDHFCGKLLGLPMGCDVCYTNHAEADQDDMDNLLVLLGAAGCNYIMGVPGADDVMLGYQSTSFHDANVLRQTLALRPAPEFEAWLEKVGVSDAQGHIRPLDEVAGRLALHAPEASHSLLTPYSNEAELKELWSHYTSARLALPRAGGSVATGEKLDFQLAHANARDAVKWPFDTKNLQKRIEATGQNVLLLESAAPDQETFLQRPDLGRQLSLKSRDELSQWCETNVGIPVDIVIVVCEGLSAMGIERHAAPLVEGLLHEFNSRNWTLGPVCVVTHGRVALQDEIGAALKARLALTLIGERPGLGSADSVSAYLVYEPRTGKSDADRNCVSNIRPAGLPLVRAIEKIIWLVEKSISLELSGVELKDEGVHSLI